STNPELFRFTRQYLDLLLQAHTYTLMLACTPHRLMTSTIQFIMGPNVRLVSSAAETVADVYRTLVSHGIERTTQTPPTHRFESTGDDEIVFRNLAARFLGPEVRHVEAFPTGTIPVVGA